MRGHATSNLRVACAYVRVRECFCFFLGGPGGGYGRGFEGRGLKESWRTLPQMLGNEALVPLTEAEMLGNEALVPFLKAKMEIMKKYLVCREGHSKLQKIALGKISSIFSVLFLDDAFFTKRAVVGGNLRYFWVRNWFRGPKSRTGPPERRLQFFGFDSPFWRPGSRFEIRATEPNASPKTNVDFPRRRPVS